MAEEYNASIFEPHVTLLSGAMQSEEDVIRRAEKLVSGRKSFPITLRTIDYQDFYFRTLFVKADKTEPLQELYDQAYDIFKMKDTPSYMPHLSLLYGNFSQAVKEKIIEAIGRDQTTQFIADRIHLFKTDGEVNAWYKVREFRFKIQGVSL